jgi:Ran-binding protein 1
LQAEESTAVFAPVVHLVEVEVKTHEEEEDVVFKRLVLALLPLFQVSNYMHRRGKLYNYGESLLNKGTGSKTWNERGTGEMKILK